MGRAGASSAGRISRTVAAAGLLFAAVAVAQQPDPANAPPPVRLPDGTFLGAAPSERVTLSQPDLQKLLDQLDQLKKQLAARRPAAPSECRLKVRVERRGDQPVAAVTATYRFVTAEPKAAVALGGRRAFPTSASLDGRRVPVFDSDDGYAAVAEAPGEHTLTFGLETPVGTRGTKGEVGFELGLPRAAITTLELAPPGDKVKRVTVATRRSDPTQPARPPSVTREPNLDLAQFAPSPDDPHGRPLGAIDALEVTWDAPAAAAAPADGGVLTADLDVVTRIAADEVETTARLRPKGAAREWRIVAPGSAELTVERAAPLPKAADPGPPPLPPTLTRPDAGKPVWKLELPDAASAADWVVTATVRQPRAKAGDAKSRGPFPVGPFALPDAARTTAAVKVTAPPNTQLGFKHGPAVRRDVPPPGADDDGPALYFRGAVGPAGFGPGPLLELDAAPARGRVAVRPTYRLRPAGRDWRVRAELRVTPINADLEGLTVELPADWRNPEFLPPEVVEGVQTVKADGPRQEVRVRLAAQREPFDLVLVALAPGGPPAGGEAAVGLPRFPGATDRDATVTVTVPDGADLTAAVRGWDGDQPAGWPQPLAPVPDADGTPPKVPTALAGTFEYGAARVDLSWRPHRPELAADLRADVTLRDGQVVVVQDVRLKAPDGLGRPVRFRGPAALTAQPPVLAADNGGWVLPAGSGAVRETSLRVVFVAPVPAAAAGEPAKVPLALLWPADATRTDATVRVWADGGRGVSLAAGSGWRELPPEADPGREAWPALTLAAAGPDLPLTLDVSGGGDPTTAVWVDRAAVEAWAGDDGAAAYRARFLLRRWRGTAVDVTVPAAAAALDLGAFVDGRRAAWAAAPGNPAAVRVPLPDHRAGGSAVLEFRYRLPPPSAADGLAFDPPRLARAEYAAPVHWLLTLPPGTAPLLLGGGRADQRWAWGGWRPLAVPATTAADVDGWFGGTAAAAGGGGERLAVAQPDPGPVRVFAPPYLVLVGVCSGVVLLAGLLLTQLPSAVSGPAVGVVAVAVAAAAALAPQPTVAAVASAAPGAGVLLAAAVGQAALRWRHRRRATYLPGFARGRPEAGTAAPRPSAVGESARGRSGLNGSTGVVPLVGEAPPVPRPG